MNSVVSIEAMRGGRSLPEGTDEAASHWTNVRQVTVWDPLVRVGHWLLVVLFFVAYFTEDDLLTLHSWAGYGIGVYLTLRVIWGFLGTEHARFSDFAYGPVSAARYLMDLLLFQARRYIGHSPAGGLMVFALLAGLAVTTVSGIALLAVEENAGPLAPWLGRGAYLDKDMPGSISLSAVARASDGEEERDEPHGERRDNEGAEVLEEVHEFFSNLTLLLVILHIAGVILASIVHRENLARAMVTGRKRAE